MVIIMLLTVRDDDPMVRIDMVGTTRDMETTDTITGLATGPDIDHGMPWGMGLGEAMVMDMATILTTIIAAMAIVRGSGPRLGDCRPGLAITT